VKPRVATSVHKRVAPTPLSRRRRNRHLERKTAGSGAGWSRLEQPRAGREDGRFATLDTLCVIAGENAGRLLLGGTRARLVEVAPGVSRC
jgi:hypothetical protein